MASLMEMVTQIITARTSPNLTIKEVLSDIREVYFLMKSLDAGQTAQTEEPAVEAAAPEVEAEPVPEVPKLSLRQAFKKDEVICMICGKGGFKTLTRHIKHVHGIKPGEYRKQFSIPSSQSLSAKTYAEERRQSALDRGLGNNLAKARLAKLEKAGKAPVVAEPVVAAPIEQAKPVKAKAPKADKAPKVVASVKPVKPAKPAKTAKTAKPVKVAEPVVEVPVAAPVEAKAPVKAKAPVNKAKAPATEKTPATPAAPKAPKAPKTPAAPKVPAEPKE